MTEDNKIIREINIITRENMIEEVELVEELKVAVIEKVVVLVKEMSQKMLKEKLNKSMKQNYKTMKIPMKSKNLKNKNLK